MEIGMEFLSSETGRKQISGALRATITEEKLVKFNFRETRELKEERSSRIRNRARRRFPFKIKETPPNETAATASGNRGEQC